MIYFNTNFKYLRAQLDLSMNNLAKELSDIHDNKEIKIPQIQSYEGSTHAKYDVLLAIRDFYREWDPNLTADDIMYRDLQSENYDLLEQKNSITPNVIQLNDHIKIIKDLEQEIKKANSTIYYQTEMFYDLYKNKNGQK